MKPTDDTSNYAVTTEHIQRAEHEVSLIVLRMRARKDDQAADKKLLDEAADRLAELKADQRAGQMRIDVRTGELSPAQSLAADILGPAVKAGVVSTAAVDELAEKVEQQVPGFSPVAWHSIDISTLPGFHAAVRAIGKDRGCMGATIEASNNFLKRKKIGGKNQEREYTLAPSAEFRDFLTELAAGNVGEDGRIRTEARAGVA